MPFASDAYSVFTVLEPRDRRSPLVFSSPHSGRDYFAEFLAASRLDPQALRKSEDSFVDELFACVAELGAPLLAARFPRAFCDPNREPYELDPAMFSGQLPVYANTRSPRVAAGLGTIPKVVGTGAEIYRGKLTVAEAERRITSFYRPYHQRLQALLDETQSLYGWSALVDCHSMPSSGGPVERDSSGRRVDVVLGDCFGASCSPLLTETAEAAFAARGYNVVRNTPYAGGFTTRHYGQPSMGCHALQIEISRALYMDEILHAKTDGFSHLAGDIAYVVAALSSLVNEHGPL